MKMKKLRRCGVNNEQGMASFLITLIMMIVITLIVIGFAQVARSEQRSALDNELSSQAYYAAESAVNEVQSIVNHYASIDQSGNIPPKKDCPISATPSSNNPAPWTSLSAQLNISRNVSYTCLQINPNPTTLVYSPITPNQSKVVEVQSDATASATINAINFSWQDSSMPASPTFSCAAATTPPNFPPAAGSGTTWNQSCGAPVLRVDIVPGDPLATGNAVTLFLYPTSGGVSTYQATSGNNGQIVSAHCSNGGGGSTKAPDACNVQLGGLNESTYYLRLLPIYTSATVTISAQHSGDAADTLLATHQGQVVVDSTAKASDVIKRIEVRLPSNDLGNSIFPDDALQSTSSLCKMFYVDQNGNLSGPGAGSAGC